MSQIVIEILQLAGEPAVVVQRGKLSYANTAARSILGEDCEGKSVAAVFGQEVAGTQGHAYVASINLNGHCCSLRTLRTKDEQVFFLGPSEATPLALSESFLIGWHSTLTNINWAVDRLRTQTEALQNREINANLSALSHSYYRLMRQSSNATFLQAYSRNAVLFQPVMLDLGALCRSCVEALRYHYPKLDLHLECRGNTLGLIDPQLFKQLIFNLIANCLIHADGLQHIRVELSEQAGYLFLSVNDDGQGIPPEQLYTIFDRYRHNYALGQLSSGSGFGLSVVRGITQLHDGALLLESRPDHGTAVRVSFRCSSQTPVSFHASSADISCSMENLLIGLADCLPDESFSARYAD